jgi:signal transduction histidine kinase
MQDRTLSAGTRGYLATAEEELLRVTQITKHTLRFHKQSTSPREFDLGELMDSVLALFRSRLVAKKITVTQEWKTGAFIEGFADELRQVFANLVSNALDATAEGGRLRIRIRKSHSWEGEMRSGVRVVVADTGQGIPEALRERIFEPFVTTKETTNIGLGMWVSEGIVRKHDGRIRLRSRVQTGTHGTVVSLFFPESLTKSQPEGNDSTEYQRV